MGRPPPVSRLLSRLVATIKRFTANLQPEAKPPGMIGAPPSARGLTGRPADPALRAETVAYEWADVAEAYCRKRMRELGRSER